MYTIDKEGRLNIPDGLIEISIGLSTDRVVLAESGTCVFQVISAEDIPDDVKVIAGPMSFDDKRRVIVPKPLRDMYSSSVKLYVMGRKLYIEFDVELTQQQKMERGDEESYQEYLSRCREKTTEGKRPLI